MSLRKVPERMVEPAAIFSVSNSELNIFLKTGNDYK